MTTDNRTNEQLAERLRQFAESQAMDGDSYEIAKTLEVVAGRLAEKPTEAQVEAAAIGYNTIPSNYLALSSREKHEARMRAALKAAGAARPVIDREAVAREVYRELYPGIIGTHDSKRTPESDLAEADRAYLTWDNGNEGFAPGAICRRVADRVIAHLDADTIAETEWEYDVVQRPEDCTTISSLAFPTLEKAKNWRQHLRNMGHGDRLIMRRRKAGEWEEIPDE